MVLEKRLLKIGLFFSKHYFLKRKNRSICGIVTCNVNEIIFFIIVWSRPPGGKQVFRTSKVFLIILLGQDHTYCSVASVTAGVMLKINLQCLKKAEPVTKRIPWGSFRFGGPERVVICVFCLVTITSSRTLWHIESRLPRTDSRHFPSNNVFPRSKEPKLTTRFLVNIFR